MSTGERRVGERGGKAGDSGGDAQWSSKELGDRAGEELVEGMSLVFWGLFRVGFLCRVVCLCFGVYLVRFS